MVCKIYIKNIRKPSEFRKTSTIIQKEIIEMLKEVLSGMEFFMEILKYLATTILRIKAEMKAIIYLEWRLPFRQIFVLLSTIEEEKWKRIN